MSAQTNQFQNESQNEFQKEQWCKRQYTIRFTTPAFLGNAEQSGAWRTPPFKALIRQWWRVLAAKKHGYDHQELRKEEAKLFGNAWVEKAYCQSRIRLRLDSWETGKLKIWPANDPRIEHPEVENRHTGRIQQIGSQLYLGYGPLTFAGGTTLKANAAIQENESATLTLIMPKNDEPVITNVMQLIHWFGTLGGRSRNGWGSIQLEGDGIQPLDTTHSLIQKIIRSLSECLQLDWPHALGCDEQGVLIWQTESFNNWRDAMKKLAQIKIAFRTSLKFVKPKGQFEDRHLLAYPVTNHLVHKWGNQARLANQLRFKVIKTANQYRGLIYHLPCTIPEPLRSSLQGNVRSEKEQCRIWQAVHQILNQQAERI